MTIPPDERRDGALARRAQRLRRETPPWWGTNRGPTASDLAAWAKRYNEGRTVAVRGEVVGT